jgi:predicted transglutaminase-like cysteine proteinase
MSNQEQFGERDYWQPPERFEESKKGDCEDFALWAWRQVLHRKYHARFALGSASRHGDGHAWVTFEKDGKGICWSRLVGLLG